MGNENEVKIGVFICDCGNKIADVVDTAVLVEGARDMPGVALAQRELFSCSKKGVRDIKQAIEEHDLNRLVVAGCTPRTHEPLFRAASEEVGLNGSLFEMVNIREQCALVHDDDREGATKKALDLIRMGVAKVGLLKPSEKDRIPVTAAALVIGGGIAGLTAALTIARGGFAVKLVEKEEQLGGMVRKLHTLYPSGESASDFIEERITEVREHPGIEIFTGTRVLEVGGSVANYQITVEQDGDSSEFGVGAIVVAIGSQEAQVEDTLGRGGEKVISQLELEQRLQQESLNARRVVMILDALHQPSYSSIPAATALKNSLVLKRNDPEIEVSLLFKYLGVDLDQRQIEEARDAGVHLVRYDGRAEPHLTDEVVEVYDQHRGEELSIPYDLAVLAMPLVPQDDAARLSAMLKTPLDESGFFLEPNIRVRLRSYVRPGIAVCGSAHYPVDVSESIFQAYRAAAETLRYLSEEKVAGEAPPAVVIESLCTGCGSCVEVCPFQAVAIEERDGTLDVSRIDALLCRGCGNCVVACPTKAIVMEPYTDEEVIAQINAALAAPRNGQPRVLGLLCEWSGYAAADLAGAEGRQYPSNLRTVKVGCSARFDPYHILWAFLSGADGVLLGACDPGMCHYVDGNKHARERVERLQKMLEQAGFDPRRLRMEWFKPDDAHRFVEVVKEFTEDVEYLGPTAVP